MNESIYIISKKFFSLTKDEVIDDVDLFFIDYIEKIGGTDNFTHYHLNRTKELYMCGWLEYRHKQINFNYN